MENIRAVCKSERKAGNSTVRDYIKAVMSCFAFPGNSIEVIKA